MPKISIIIPTFNRSVFLSEAILSVFSQTFSDYELIVVDDGSTDDTKVMLEALSDNLKYIYQDHKGVSAARNRGISEASGQYIAFLDSDDLWDKNKLAEQVAFMDNNSDAMICYTNEIWIRKGVRVNPMKKHSKYSGWIFDRCLPLCIISPSSVFMKKEIFDIVGLFDENLPVCEDYDLWLRISLVCQVFFIDKKLIVKHGGHSDQLSNSSWGNDIYRVAALEKILKNKKLEGQNRRLVLQQLVDKSTVLYKGFEKRGKEEGKVYKDKMVKYLKESKKVSESRKLTSVTLNNIITENRDSVFTYPVDITMLTGSIKVVGLIQPVVLRRIGKTETYQVISGYKRVFACKAAGLEKIQAYVYEEDELDEKTGFLIGLHDNVSIRALNIIEKSNSIEKLLNVFHLQEQDIIKNYLPLLGVDPSFKLLGYYLKLATLEDDIKRYVIDEDLSLDNAVKLSGFSSTDRKFIVTVFSKLKLGSNKLKQIFTALEEIALRDMTSIADILDEPSIKEIFSNQKLSIPQQTKEFIREIKKRRYPQLTMVEDRISQGIKKMHLPSSIKIVPPQFFEGDTWSMDIRLTENSDIAEIGKKITSISDDIKKVMESIWDNE